MQTQRPPVVWLAAAVMVGLLLGGAITTMFSGWFFGYADNTRLIADVTTDVSALERIASGDTAGAGAILRARLEGSMMGLNASESRLTTTQQSQAAAIEVRARKFLTAGE